MGLLVLAGLLADDAWAGALATLGAFAGVGLLLAGSLLVVRGFVDLGRNLTALPRPRQDAHLVESGIYGRVRHPLYGGIIVGSFGYALLMRSLLALLLAGVVAVFFWLKSQREEAWLRSHYPAYAAYAGRTRRFIPWLV